MADQIARRYGTDPWSVMQWGPERFGFALGAWLQSVEDKGARMEAIKAADSAMVFPTFDVLGM